jgi:hypothetical protein
VVKINTSPTFCGHFYEQSFVGKPPSLGAGCRDDSALDDEHPHRDQGNAEHTRQRPRPLFAGGSLHGGDRDPSAETGREEGTGGAKAANKGHAEMIAEKLAQGWVRRGLLIFRPKAERKKITDDPGWQRQNKAQREQSGPGWDA